jgi:ketosteroid isomerase-like protein
MDSPTLDSHGVEPPLPESVPGTNLRAIEEAFRTFTDVGAMAGVEALLLISHHDCRFAPPGAAGRVLEGREEVLAYYEEAAAGGTSISVRPRSFTEHGDEVEVSGSMRVIRSEGSFAESQVRWIYRFRDGLIEEARWSPRHCS